MKVNENSTAELPPGRQEGTLLGREDQQAPGRWRSYGLPAAAVAGGLGVLGFLRNRFQRHRTFVPDRYPNGIWDPQAFGLPAQDVWFSAPDGVDLHGWWIPGVRTRGTLLYCHGNTGSIAHQIGLLKHMRRLRVNLLAFDYRGYGRSSGSPSESGLFADVRAAFDFAVDTLRVPANEIVLFGHSLGGAVAIDCALDRPAAGLIAQATFTNMRAAAKALFPTVPLHWAARNQFRSVEKVSQITIPKLFVHGSNDGTLPLELGRELYEAAAEPKELFEVPRAGHNDLYRHGGLLYLRRLARFRDRCLR